MKAERTQLRALKDLVRGLVSLTLLAVLVAGVPVALASLAGWPLPGTAPHLEAVTRALSQSDLPDVVLIKGAACVCWAAWAVLVVCVAVEMAAWVRCYTARRLPFVGPFQVWAARLVASALLVFSSFGGLVRPAAAAQLRPTKAQVVQLAPDPTIVRPLRVATPTRQRPARPLRVTEPGVRRQRPLRVATGESTPEESLVPAGTPDTPIPPGTKHYSVQPDQGRRYDTLWGIAERHLGDPLRWPEIAQLNEGRVSAKHRFGNPHWIFPGEVLLVPADAVDVDGTPLPAATAGPAPVAPPPTPARAPVASRAQTPAPPTTAPAPQRVTTPAPAGQAAARPSIGAVPGIPAAPTLPDIADVNASSEPHATTRAPATPSPSAPASGNKPSTTTASAPATAQDPPATAAADPPAIAAQRPLRATQQDARLERPVRAPAPTTRTTKPVSAAKPDTHAARAFELGAMLLTGAGVIEVLRRLRNAQQRRRRPGRHIPLPDAQLARTEATLRREGDVGEAMLLDRALRVMAAGLAEDNLEAPAIAGVQLTSRAVEILLAEPSTDAPRGFRASGDGRRWVYERSTTDVGLPAGTLQPLPTLVTLGRGAKGLVLVNLESAGVVSVTGGEAARELISRAGVELATSTARGNDTIDVVLVGFGDGLETVAGVRVVESLEDVIVDVEARSQEAVESVMRLGCGSTLGSRIAGYDGEFTPLVVVSSTPPSDAALAERLVEAAAAECSGVVVLIAGAMKGARWRLRVAGGELEVPALGLTVQTEGLTAAQTDDTGRLVAIAAETDDVAELPEDWPWDPYGQDESESPSPESPSVSSKVRENKSDCDADVSTKAPASSVSRSTNGHNTTETSGNGHRSLGVSANRHWSGDDGNDATADQEASAPDPGPFVDDPYTASVDVMGPVRICGGDRPIERAKSIELLTLLAMRRQGLTAEQAETALWPSRAPATNTLNTVTTGARTPLGKSPDGTPLILHVRRGPNSSSVRKLHPLVSSDYERFAARVRHAGHRPVLGAIQTLREALELVRGCPFEATPAGGYEWAMTGLAESVRRDVVDAAVRLCELCMEIGDIKGARWAADQGRRADPYHEGLARLAMEAADLDGDQSGVKAVMTALRVGVEEGVEPYDDLEQETTALYRDLTRARRSTARLGSAPRQARA